MSDPIAAEGRRPPEFGADRAARDRAALRGALAALNARLTGAAAGQAAGSAGKGAVWLALGAAAAGFGLAHLLRRRRTARTAAASPPPEWLGELHRVRARAQDLLDRIAHARAEGRLPGDEAAAAEAEVRAAEEAESRRALGLGLEGLEGAERAAVLDLRRARAAGAAGAAVGLPGLLAAHPVLASALAAAAAAALERAARPPR